MGKFRQQQKAQQKTKEVKETQEVKKEIIKKPLADYKDFFEIEYFNVFPKQSKDITYIQSKANFSMKIRYLKDLPVFYPFTSFNDEYYDKNKARKINKFSGYNHSLVLCDQNEKVLSFCIRKMYLVSMTDSDFTKSSELVFGAYNEDGKLFNFTYELVKFLRTYDKELSMMLSKNIILNVNDGFEIHPGNRYFPMYLCDWLLDQEKAIYNDVLNRHRWDVYFSIILMEHQGFYCPFMMITSIDHSDYTIPSLELKK